MKKLLFSLFAAGTIFCLVPTSFAASDIESHWAKSYIESLNADGVINPSSSGDYSPDEEISRAEFMRYINRAFGFTETTSISFSDVASEAWYYETVQIASNYGYITGVGNNKMNPDDTLTREQAATILGRLHKYTPDADVDDISFSDKGSINDWSLGYVVEAVNQGYIDGYNDGTFMPQGAITRAEISKILYYFMGTSLQNDGASYTEADLNEGTKNVSISGACTLSDVTIEGNLYVTEGADSGYITLDDVTVKGQIIVSGKALVLEDVNAAQITVSSPMAFEPTVSLVSGTSIAKTDVKTSCSLIENELDSSAGGFSAITLNGAGIELTLDAGDVWELTVDEKATINASDDTVIEVLTANASVDLYGGKSIGEARLNTTGCNIEDIKPGTVTLGSGATATIKGETVESEYAVIVSPATLSFAYSDRTSLSHSYDFTFSGASAELGSVTVDGKSLVVGTDYTAISGNAGVRLYKTYLSELSPGSHMLTLIFDDGTKGFLTIQIADTETNAVSPQSFTFDIYTESSNYVDMGAVLSLPTGTTLTMLTIGSKTLERGTDYSYNSSTGAIVIYKEALENFSVGSYTITFKTSKGTSATSKLTVVDTKPVNTLSVESVDFDANTTSGGYQDITVKLTAADDATLTKIRCNGETLEENWQYQVSGSNVILNKSAVAKFASDGANYADFVFAMSSGVSPVLRVNYVTTYGWTIQVVDDLGAAISGVTVVITPSDTDSESSAQTLTTDSEGKVVAYVKKGSYTAVASGGRLAEAVSVSKTAVNANKSTVLTAKVLESLTLTVINSFGAKLEGATVTIDGTTKKTGSDGVVTFELARGSYSAQISCSGYTTQVKTYTLSSTMKERVTLT